MLSDIVSSEPCWSLCWPELCWCSGDEGASDQCISVLGIKAAMCPREKGCLCPSTMQLWDPGTHPCLLLHTLLVFLYGQNTASCKIISIDDCTGNTYPIAMHCYISFWNVCKVCFKIKCGDTDHFLRGVSRVGRVEVQLMCQFMGRWLSNMCLTYGSLFLRRLLYEPSEAACIQFFFCSSFIHLLCVFKCNDLWNLFEFLQNGRQTRGFPVTAGLYAQ